MTISIDDILKEMEQERVAASKKAKKTSKDLLPKLLDRNVKYVLIQFAGYGDSGSIETIDFTLADGTTAEGEQFKQTAMGTIKPETATLADHVEDWALKYLEGAGVDWYNNEGGQGEIHIDLTNPPFSYSAYIDVNIQKSVREHEDEGIF